MMAKKENNYFKMFSDIAADAITAAQQLEKTIINYNPEKKSRSSTNPCTRLSMPPIRRNMR